MEGFDEAADGSGAVGTFIGGFILQRILSLIDPSFGKRVCSRRRRLRSDVLLHFEVLQAGHSLGAGSLAWKYKHKAYIITAATHDFIRAIEDAVLPRSGLL
jgi:hypothetical protein